MRWIFFVVAVLQVFSLAATDISAQNLSQASALAPRFATVKKFEYGNGDGEIKRVELEVHPESPPSSMTRFVIEVAREIVPQGARFLDWGTRDGSISLVLKDWLGRGVALEVNPVFEEITRANFKRHGIRAVELRDNHSPDDGSLFAGVKGMRFDVIIVNPPHLPQPDLDQAISLEDPMTAQYAGSDGRYFIDRIIHQAGPYLTENGILIIGHAGYLGVDQTVKLMEQNGLSPTIYSREGRRGPETLVWQMREYIEEKMGVRFKLDDDGYLIYEELVIVGRKEGFTDAETSL